MRELTIDSALPQGVPKKGRRTCPEFGIESGVQPGREARFKQMKLTASCTHAAERRITTGRPSSKKAAPCLSTTHAHVSCIVNVMIWKDMLGSLRSKH